MQLMNIDLRLQQLQTWLAKQLSGPAFRLEAMPNDASFRRYFRIYHGAQRYIVMDAPLDREDPRLFTVIAAVLFKLGINVPQILAQDLQRGFLLLTDLGTQLYISALKTHDPDKLYQSAIAALLRLQSCKAVTDIELPVFDREFMLSELAGFSEWFLQKELGLCLTAEDEAIIQDAYDYLAIEIAAQPTVFVHRDFHSRNLLMIDEAQVGVLDFQDAMWGPITYDIVSLLRDCYISWPDDKVKKWALYYWQQAQDSGMIAPCEAQQFLYWFDLMGIQRHLKACGIFARLHKRDQKPAYLQDIPQTLSYILSVGDHYAPLKPFMNLLQSKVMPAYQFLHDES